MKISLRPPCRECPFLKKAIPGWLGSDTPEEVWAQVHTDGEFGYPCHMDVDRAALEPGYDNEDPGSVEQCVGAMLHAKKTAKQYSDPWRQAGVEAVSRVVGVDGVMGFDFMEHHKKKLTGKRR